MNRQFQQQTSQQQSSSSRQVVQQQSQVTSSQQQFSRVEQHVTRQVTSSTQQQQRVQGMVYQTSPQPIVGRPGDASPPVFEQIFRNARFAQDGNATFEGRVRGNPTPTVSWTKQGVPIHESNKYHMNYDAVSGDVSLVIVQIGPGDEGEYTCNATNQYGEAICSIRIQPEGQGQQAMRTLHQQQQLQQQQQSSTVIQGGYRKEYAQTFESSQQISGSQIQSSYQKTSSMGKSINYTNGTNGTAFEEDFKVDTFEYRLLREVEFRQSITRRVAGEADAEINNQPGPGPVAPPQIAQKPRNSKLLEGSDATFSAKIPGNPAPRLSWFKNGVRIQLSQKYQSSYVNQTATLNIKQAQSTDSGHYTLLAENPQGCVVSSAYLAIEPVGQHDDQQLKSFIQGTSQVQQQQQEIVVESSEGSKNLAPNFLRVCTDREATEGKMTRFDCRVTGRPYPEVTWYLNGRQICDDATHKILVNESGNHALMITNVSRLDTGTISCVARNKSGETSFECQLNVLEKEQVVAPKFVERFTTVQVKEGEPVVLTARAVGTPIPRITWQKDGVPCNNGPNLIIATDGGASQLDIPAAQLCDAAWYQCTAQNVAGSTATRARLFVEGPKGSTPEPRRLNLPRPTKVIEPQAPNEPEVIFLRHVERAKPHQQMSEPDKAYPPPQFVVPLQDVTQSEGGRIKLEARVEPVGDPTMIVEWFINGRPLAASSRATTTFRFGYICLELMSIIREDSGEYVCRVTSASGVAQSQALLSVTARAGIEQTSQYPGSLQQIQQLEDYSRYQRTETVDETSMQRPNFVKPLQDLGELQEGRNAHFEAQLTPVSDPTMRLEWYKDGKAITASSRITTIFNFGYVSLNIMHLRAEDAGVYTVRAYNALGEAISNSNLKVLSRSSVTAELGIPEQQRYIEKISELESHQQQQYAKYMVESSEVMPPPEFKSPIKDQKAIREGGFAHFEARLEPVGDSSMRVEWYKDGRPVEASSRITAFFNFGYVALTIKYVTVHDVGLYTCRAVNESGQSETSAQLSVISKTDVVFESQHPQGLEKIQYLEDSSRYGRTTQEETTVTQKPRFLGPLKGTNKIVEGQRAHFEVRVEPQNDNSMQIEWYHNGQVIMSASRVQTYYDFGYVALDIISVRSEDIGTYTVVARNALGEAQLSATMEVETRSSIDTSSMHRMTMEKTRHLEESKFQEPQYYIEEISKSKPIFVQPLSDPQPVSEGKNIHLECRLEPMGDPTMRVEWYFNGKAITVGSRFKTYYDFGYVAIDIIHCTTYDSGEYTVRAVNHLGTAHTSACVRIISREGVESDTMNEEALKQIYMLEDHAARSSQYSRGADEGLQVQQAPQFTKPLHNVDIIEGTNVHLECRLQPVNDSSMRVEWFVNGRPIKTGHRFRPAHDFDYVALDLLSVYPEDSGVYSCQAYNMLGEAVTSCSVKVIAKRDLILDTQHQSSLEKMQYLEDSSRYRKQEMMEEIVNIRPRFVTKPKSFDNMREGQHCHFECKLEPVTDSNLKVEWYKNGRPITVGHRFRPIHDFGYVALDIIDLIAEDSGIYTCRAVNMMGADETTCTLQVKSSAQILTSTQNQSNLEQLQYLEDRSRTNRTEYVEESTAQAPVFTSSIKNIVIKEGQRAHFECRLIPVSDPTMKVEWFHNNVPLRAGSRFTETNAFGFVALDIMYAYPEDSGTYTCRASNALGQAMTSATLGVQSKKSIYLETQHESAMTKINYLEGAPRGQPTPAPEDSVIQAPVFTQPMRDLKVTENQPAHFEARLIPVGDPRLRVEWLRNGVPIQASNRVTTMHDFGYVALNMKYVYPEDSGTYTCRAVNDLGQAVTSSQLDCRSKESLLFETQSITERQQFLDDSSRISRKEDEETIITQPPKFTTKLNGPTQLVEGQSCHFECRVEPYPDPNLTVEWYHNGLPLQSGHRFRTTYDFGFAALDILSVYAEDAGEYTCKATNRLGTATSSIKITVKSKASIIIETQHEGAMQKIQYLESDHAHKRDDDEEGVHEKPQFGRPLRNLEKLVEGQSAHLEATLTPVNDPTMRVEWYCNGRPIPQGHRFKTTYDFGFVALDILYAYAEDSGTYMCKARNAVGEAVTTCSIKVEAEKGLCLDTLDEDRLKKIRSLESYARPQKEEVEAAPQKPVFITPLNSLENLKEGEHAHLECRVEPINDPNLRVEWFVNGIAIRTGHRFRTTHDFGYVALDVLYTYQEDSGTYMCKATNLQGEAVNTCNINCSARRSIYLDSQHPEGFAKIQELEAQGHQGRLEVEEPAPAPPMFITQLHGNTELVEGQNAHFECRVEPIHDPNLRIEFYHNGKPLPSASRFHITFDFGYVALDMSHVYPEDAGEYTVKAINNLGQCSSSITINVTGKSGVIFESARPEGLEKIKQLEGHQHFQRPDIEDPKTTQRPVFTAPLQNIDALGEGQTAHFECRLIPVNDPTLKVEWFRNEQPIETSSRITRTHDFGFVALDMTHVRDEDEGVYMCRASNALGEAVTTASMRIRTKASIQLETQHPEGMRKIQALEMGPSPRAEESDKVFEKPIFTQVLTGPSEVWEGQNAHFECRVVPVGDPNLKFEWFVNGVELKMGSRFQATHDFGYVNLDISKTVPEDAGVYMCKAINLAGEAVSSASLKVKTKSSIVQDPLQPDAWEKIQLAEAERNRVPEMFVDTTPQQAPVFTTHLTSFDKLVEGQHVRLEAQVEPRADPNLRVEWFKNGVSLTTGTRIRSTFDFGLVTLAINGLRADDSAIYTCKATNRLGEAVSTCTLKIEDRHWLLGSSLRPDALPIIEALETPKEVTRESSEPVFESPVFITHLNNVEMKEGENAHFECNVEPSKDPTMEIEWFVNGKPLPSGARYKSTYDFGFVGLDISGCYAEDSGIYTCKATNSKGQAVTTGTLRCTAKSSIYLDTQHPQGQAGLEKVLETDDAYASKYQRQSSGPEAEFPKPIFITPLEPQFNLGETEPLHLECNVEPKNDPNLKVEWFFNGKSLEHGSRFKMTSDFGYVTLDLTDVYERDQGIYTCKAYNLQGEAFTSTTIYCTGKEGLIDSTQHPKGKEGLEAIQDLEDSLSRPDGKAPESDEGQAPQFTSQFQNLANLSEGDIAHFEASLTPVGDQSMVVEWYYKGEVLKASHRVRTVYAFGMVVLEILGTKIEDSGEYTCRATNKWGKAEISVNLECVDKSKGQKPQFTSQIQSLEGLKDGDSAHFECTLVPVGDPALKVEWFHNGQPLRHSSRIKTVSDFGFVVLDIAYVQSHDSGEYICKATNKYGEDTTRATIKCAGKGGVYLDSLQPESLARIRELESQGGQQAGTPTSPTAEAPKFITQISNVESLKEGQSAHFEARLTPIADPTLTVEWYYNGKKLPHGHRYRTFHDFGIVILDILYCYEENSGEYECRATNKVGTDSTKASLKCVSKANLILDSQLPQGMEGGLEKIQNLEDSLIRTRDERSTEDRGKAPVFTVPLSNIDNLREGESSHFEARLTPTDDPKLKVEWFWNGKPLKTGSRFRTFCDFGFVILEISPVYPEDSGEYSCRAFNDYGEAVTTATMKVQGKRSIILDSQLPKGMERTIEKIAELEGLGAQTGQIPIEEDLGKPPEFVTTPTDLTLGENSLAHFECRLTPLNDPSMRVEWFHNGKALWSGSRIKTINDFGFVILELSGVYQRDSGLYTCKATNRHGEATVSCKLQVRGRQGIVLEPQLPNNFRTGTESLQRLEETLHKRDEVAADEEKPDPPRFTTELKDVLNVPEGGPAHFDCRVEPVGDHTMRIDWFLNGRPFPSGSRVHNINDFGYVTLDLDWTYPRDSGELLCRATNRWGSATTKANLTCKAKRGIIMETQLPEGLVGEKLRDLEKGNLTTALKEDAPLYPPKFITQIESVSVGEGEPIHFECRVEPKIDPNLKVQWFHNGKALSSGHRFKSQYDFGYVALDILYAYPEDSGEYECRATNELGSDVTKARVSCKMLPNILLHNQVPKGMKKSEAVMQMEATIKKYTSEIHLTAEDIYDVDKKQPPRFVTQIKDQKELVEMQSTKFECQLAPVGDPNMKVEWFFNGKPLPHKNRFTPIYDFGYVAMNFGWVYPEDSGEYLCRATNLYGSDETRAYIKTTGKPGIIYESQLPKHMKSIERIREMEAAWQMVPNEPDEDDKPKQAPVFALKPEPCLIEEGRIARFTCRVIGHPKPRVMWLVNGHTVLNGTRYKLTFDGMWHLDIPKVRQYDNGKVEVIARNSVGEAYSTVELTVTARNDDFRGVLKNSPRQYLKTKEYRKPEWVTRMEELQEQLRATQSPPVFIQEITDARGKEGDTVTFECVLSGTPQPDVVWYHEERMLRSMNNIKIGIKNNKTSCTVSDITLENEGVYICKAMNDAGTATSKANLFCHDLSEDEKRELEERRARDLEIKRQEEEEKERRKAEKLAAKKMAEEAEMERRQRQQERVIEEKRKLELKLLEQKKPKEEKIVVEKVQLKPVTAQSKTVETTMNQTKEFSLKLGKQVAQTTTVTEQRTMSKVVSKSTDVRISALQGSESVDQLSLEEVQNLSTHPAPSRKAQQKLPVQETVSISEVETIEPILKPKRRSVPQTQRPIITQDISEAAYVEEMMDYIGVDEFGPVAEAPLKDLAKISFRTKQGVTMEEVTSAYEAGEFPALRAPEAQMAMVQLVERQGHGAIIAEVVAEESATPASEERLAATGFRALLKVVDQGRTEIEEVLTHFAPEDFQWDAAASSEVKVERHSSRVQKTVAFARSEQSMQEIRSENVGEVQFSKRSQVTASSIASEELATAHSTEVFVKEQKSQLKKKTRLRQSEIQEDASLSITQQSLDTEESQIVATECREGDKMYAICSYVAENEEALNLVEGERVYIVECHNSDWWFVKKHLTEETGWAPAQMLKNEPKYAEYVQKKLHEKIDKLPVFEKPSPGEPVSAPRFTEKLQPKHTPDGATIQFECRVEGSPRPLITWFRQTAIIKPSPDFQIFYDEDNVATLVIKEVFPEDAGMFTCVAKNAAGFASSTTELVVEAPLSDHGSEVVIGHSRKSLSRESSLADILEGIPPTFAQKPRTRTVDEKSSVELECRLVAVPEPDLVWYFNGKELRESKDVIISMDSDMHSYMTVVKINNVKKTHEGVYEVVAKNREGTASNQVVLKVITGAKEPPQILEPLKSTVVTEGDSVVMSTQILANPKPKVTWYRNGVELKPDGKNAVTKVEKDMYTLTIYHTSQSDDGDYMVSAENEVGSAQTSAILCIEELVELKPEPPLFVERFEEQKVPSKGVIQLAAKVTGNPQPEIAWFRNNKRLKTSKNIKEIYDGENILLEIACGEDGSEDGDYKCVATNSVGKASHGARVCVEADTIKFTKKLQAVEAEDGSTAKLECHTSQSVTTKWYRDNKEINVSDKSKYELVCEGKKHVLTIKKVTHTDAAQYKCTAKDQSTQAALSVREGGMEFVRKLVDFEVKERELAILEVEVSTETAKVSWHKDGEELQEGDERFDFERDGRIRKLLIRCTSVHDEGEYTCALGEQECTAEVTVVELPPEIIHKMQDVTIAKGERATFEIELTKGDALVRWFKDGAELQFSEHVQLAIDGKRQRLMVYNALPEDAGEYSCQVGEQTSIAKLKVEEPVVEFTLRLPDVTLTPQNTDAMFTVELSQADVEVTWLRNGKPITESDRYVISAERTIRKLVVKKITMDDQAEYTCVAINVKSSSKLKVEIIETAPRINMDSVQKEYRVKKGEDVNISVKYSAIPQPKDEWFVNGKVIKKTKRINPTIDEASASLTIQKVEEEDCGNLTLKLVNNCGEASAELNLILMKEPSQPGTPEVIEITNETVTLHWKAPEYDGNAKIDNYILEYHDKADFLTWTKVTETITETTHKVCGLKHNVEYMFRVTAVNVVGPSPVSQSTRYIKITEPVSAEPPVIQQPLEDVTSGLGVPVTLSCVIGGVPEPEIKWLRDGKVFKTKTMTYENRIAKLVITQVSETSGAKFTCQAKNEAGEAETSCSLTVQEKPKLEVDENLVAQKQRVNNQWKIEVKFSGFPKPQVSWSKDGKKLETNKQCSIYVDEASTTIAIYSLTRNDSGIYTVTAKNSAGTTTIDLNLRVIDDTVRLSKSRSPSEEPIDKPSKPEGPLVVKKIQKESVTIEWKPPADDGGLEISKYSVEKCDVKKMVWMKVADIEGQINSYCIQRLNEGSEYMFRVIAANPIGYSEPLESKTIVVKSQYEAPSPPRGPLDISGMTDTSLTIKWQPPETDGGAVIIEYLVERREVSKKAWQKVGTTTAELTHIEVSSLKLNTSYHFRITARNEVGSSQPFAPEEAITVGKRITPPSAPSNLTVVDITSRSVTLQWGPPLSTGGTEITGYIIEKRISSSKTYEKFITLEPSVTQYCIQNLKEKSEYFFRVYAENAMGLSEPAETECVRLKTHASPPTPPTAPLETRGTGPNSIVIAWGIPESDGGAPIEGYTIAIKDTRKTMWMEVGRVKADVQKLNIKDLQEGHEYMLRIFARNEVGQSDPLESEEPIKVLRPADSEMLDLATRDDREHDAPSLSLTTETTTSWMKEAGMDADIHTYARGSLLRKDEYFFKIWHHAKKLFK